MVERRATKHAGDDLGPAYPTLLSHVIGDDLNHPVTVYVVQPHAPAELSPTTTGLAVSRDVGYLSSH